MTTPRLPCFADPPTPFEGRPPAARESRVRGCSRRGFASFAAACALMLGVPLAAAAASPACEAKRAEIEASLADAQARGQAREVRGLKKALDANRANCTDASLAKEREDDIRKARKEVAEREADLRSAQRKGDADKIAKRQSKLDDARAELERVSKPPMQ